MALPAALRRVSEAAWELPVSYKEGMLVPARIYATEKLITEMDDAVWDQVTNVATLPGIVQYALLHAGWSFRLWLPDRRSSSHGRRPGRRHLSRRYRF